MEHYLHSGRTSIPNADALWGYIPSNKTDIKKDDSTVSDVPLPPNYRDLEKKIDLTPVVKLKGDDVLLSNVFRALVREIMVKYSFDIPKDIEVVITYASKHLSIVSICVATYVTDMYDMLNAIVQQ
jgi:hypothetical protein